MTNALYIIALLLVVWGIFMTGYYRAKHKYEKRGDEWKNISQELMKGQQEESCKDNRYFHIGTDGLTDEEFIREVYGK